MHTNVLIFNITCTGTSQGKKWIPKKNSEIWELVYHLNRGSGKCRPLRREKMIFRKDEWALRRRDGSMTGVLVPEFLTGPFEASLARILQVGFSLCPDLPPSVLYRHVSLGWALITFCIQLCLRACFQGTQLRHILSILWFTILIKLNTKQL